MTEEKREEEKREEFKGEMIKFAKEFPKLEIEKKEDKIPFDDEIYHSLFFLVNKVPGVGDLELYVRNMEHLENLKKILATDFLLFDDFLGIRKEKDIEIYLNPITIPYSLSVVKEGESKTIFDVKLNYLKNELDIKIQLNPQETFIPILCKQIRGFRLPRARSFVLTIKNLSKTSSEGLMSDVRSIINSVLFDIEYTYSTSFETVNIQSFIRRNIRRKKIRNEVPTTPINLIHKNYIPELIEYYHIGEKVDFLPFKYICYYHIIEYFSDKSAYYVVSEKLKSLLLKPDFHQNTNKYVAQAINFFKKENDRYTSDKIKIDRVLNQFIDREELKEHLIENETISHFEKECILECNKELTLPKIDFSQDANFYTNLTKRVYSLRCSIVHSNPDFDDTKAIPFITTPKNMDNLRIEIDMIREIARMIIIGTKE
ncbi:hypothetical protein [Flavobacterium sp. F52]|uniref:hypothetical protein n=1 Tax=Flavobacterium sp. F52 TaxID=1202532 RepID=UPI000272DF71|nr:hypothetical protein [Flavobacterium sp. F52]EJG03394.1 hypothetical protein FF52_00555 [Flavobacterium sp. F52]